MKFGPVKAHSIEQKCSSIPFGYVVIFSLKTLKKTEISNPGYTIHNPVFGVLSIYNFGLPTTYACNVAIYATFRYTYYICSLPRTLASSEERNEKEQTLHCSKSRRHRS